MNDLKISLYQLVAVALIAAGFAMTVGNAFIHTDIGDVGSLLAISGGLAQIRLWMCRVKCDERRAFEAGRAVGLAEQSGAALRVMN